MADAILQLFCFLLLVSVPTNHTNPAVNRQSLQEQSWQSVDLCGSPPENHVRLS